MTARTASAAVSKFCGLTAQTTISAISRNGPGRRARADAELADQAAPGSLARLDDDDRGARAAALDEAADEGLRHVAAADEDDVAHAAV